MKNEDFFYNLNNEVHSANFLSDMNVRLHESWFKEDTVDFWRHNRMYETFRPVAEYFRDKRWLTIGDGRYGLDSVKVKKKFSIKDILPTDISPEMLAFSKEKGLFNDFRVENAEKLSFEDNSFDVVLCKEAFHHFPRPIIALYEMIRVCKSAVILIEPPDYPSYSLNKKEYLQSFFKIALSMLKKKIVVPPLVNINPLDYEFEESGNYIYSVSTREMEKIVQGLDLGGVAWKCFNDCYEEGCEFENAEDGNPMFERIKKYIEERDENCKKNPDFYRYGTATFVIFKNEFDSNLKSKMETYGYFFPKKRINPYIK